MSAKQLQVSCPQAKGPQTPATKASAVWQHRKLAILTMDAVCQVSLLETARLSKLASWLSFPTATTGAAYCCVMPKQCNQQLTLYMNLSLHVYHSMLCSSVVSAVIGWFAVHLQVRSLRRCHILRFRLLSCYVSMCLWAVLIIAISLSEQCGCEQLSIGRLLHPQLVRKTYKEDA